jgi:endonuclease VIII-like 1
MNQKYFSGIGNYIRAEVLYRFNELGFNPFLSIKKYTKDNESIIKLCQIIKDVMIESYEVGGATLKEWHNPDELSVGKDTKEKFESWRKCYGNKQMSKIKDNQGRTFWYNPKLDKIKKTVK